MNAFGQLRACTVHSFTLFDSRPGPQDEICKKSDLMPIFIDEPPAARTRLSAILLHRLAHRYLNRLVLAVTCLLLGHRTFVRQPCAQGESLKLLLDDWPARTVWAMSQKGSIEG